MIELQLKPTIYSYDTCREFVEDLQVGADDLIITNQYIFDPNFKDLGLTCHVLFQEKYGMGEPSDEMAEAIYKDMPKDVKRIIGIGGGTVMDLCKLFILKQVSPVLDLFDGKIPVEKAKELILIPTTCGTGSEVTNVSVMALVSRNTKKGIADNALYADKAVLIAQLLKTLPFKVLRPVPSMPSSMLLNRLCRRIPAPASASSAITPLNSSSKGTCRSATTVRKPVFRS